MTNDDQWVTYAKEHKKEFLARIIPEQAPPKEGRTAYLTAGGPGSGKSEFREIMLPSENQICIIDPDEFRAEFPGYDGQNAAEYQRASSYLVDYCFGKLIRKKLPLILDQTFSSPRSLQNVQRLLDHGYRVILYYVYENPAVAWSFAQKRDRIVPKEAFIRATLNAYDNVVNAWNMFHNNSNFFLDLFDQEHHTLIPCSSYEQLLPLEDIVKGGL